MSFYAIINDVVVSDEELKVLHNALSKLPLPYLDYFVRLEKKVHGKSQELQAAHNICKQSTCSTNQKSYVSSIVMRCKIFPLYHIKQHCITKDFNQSYENTVAYLKAICTAARV